MLSVPDSFPVANNSCIISAFAATDIDNIMFAAVHIDSVTLSNFGFVLCAVIAMLSPPKLLISCS